MNLAKKLKVDLKGIIRNQLQRIMIPKLDRQKKVKVTITKN